MALLPAAGFLLMALVALWPQGAPVPVVVFVWAAIAVCCAAAGYLAFFAADGRGEPYAGIAAIAGLAGAAVLLFSGMATFLLLVDAV